MIEHDRLYIGGELVAPSGSATIDVINPFTEAIAGRVPDATEADVDKAVAIARRTFDTTDWSTRPVAERAAILTKVSAGITEPQCKRWPDLITTEMGSALLVGRIMGQVFAAVHGLPTTTWASATPRSTRSSRSRAGTFGSGRSPQAARSAWSGPSCRGTCRCS